MGLGDKGFAMLRLKCEHDKAWKDLPWKSDGETMFLDSPFGFSEKMHWREKALSRKMDPLPFIPVTGDFLLS